MSASTYRNLATASRVVKFWKDACDPSGWEPAGFDPNLSIPACMICGYSPHVVRLIVGDAPNARYMDWKQCGLHRAHLHSHALGGSGDASNLIMACGTCNRLMPQKRSREAALGFLLESNWAARRFAGWAMLHSAWRIGTAGEVVDAFKELRAYYLESRMAEEVLDA